MLVIPAVDIKRGKAVRLIQGKADQETIYDEDPLRPAQRWADAGARRVHVIDLDGAFDGKPANLSLTLQIVKTFPHVEIETGGGLRTFESVAQLIASGTARCVIGTAAAEDIAFLSKLAHSFPGKINLGLDAKDGWVVTKGWVEVTELKAAEWIKQLGDLPLGEVIYTDIDRDGMLEGPNLRRLDEIRESSPFPIIASGGVATLEHIRQCKELGCFGCIVGKALYDGRIDVKDALAAGE